MPNKNTPQDDYLDAHDKKHGLQIGEKLFAPDTTCGFYDTIDEQGNIVIHCTNPEHPETAIIGKRTIKD